MIKIENVETSNWRAAVRGMRNPLESWDKSDSYFQDMYCGCFTRLDEECIPEVPDHYQDVYLGPNDLDLMKRLVNAGTDHSKFMRMITVSFDIVAPLYWWKEFDTYKIGTVRNSCSTMHKIEARPLVINDFSKEGLEPDDINILMEVILYINKLIEKYKKATGESKLAIHRRIVKLLPDSYLQRATITTNYQVLRNIRNSDRKHHKLLEWQEDFIKFVDSLPYAEELLIKDDMYKYGVIDKEYKKIIESGDKRALAHFKMKHGYTLTKEELDILNEDRVEKKDECQGCTCYQFFSYPRVICPHLTKEDDIVNERYDFTCNKKQTGISIPFKNVCGGLEIFPGAFNGEEF